MSSQQICLHSQIVSHPMLGNLINIMEVKFIITITSIWRHHDVHTGLQNLHYAIRCIVWRKQNHADELLEDRQTKRHPFFFSFFFKCVIFASPLMT